MHTPGDSAETPAVVSVAFGWRARDVERRATMPVRFSDQDVGVVIVEREPVALQYAEGRHTFTLPPGLYLRADQAAGRVFSAAATPHLAAMTAAEARALVDSIARLLDGAGWTRVANAGAGVGAVDAAARFAASGQGGFGDVHVGTWRVPRSAAPWAALPAGAPVYDGAWNGVEAVVTVRPVGAVAGPEAARYILQVRAEDELLSTALQAQAEARRARLGGDVQTLGGWDAQPNEALGAAPAGARE